MKQNILLIALLSVISFVQLSAQSFCGHDEVHSSLLRKDPDYARDVQKLNDFIYEYTRKYDQQKNRNRYKPNYTLPVVVHLIVPPGTPIGKGNNLTDLQIEQGLEYLNQAFANSGPYIASNGVDVGIRFCLARRDPGGNPTNGITRHESNLVSDTMCNPGTNAFNDSQIKRIVSWDCREYINIWLVTDLYNTNFGCDLVGYAYFPGASCTLDGIVQESRFWNTIRGAEITAHEMGHFLALDHTFNGGCTNSDCLIDGDKVCDTPPDNSPSFAACDINSCNTDLPDMPDDNSNYMDYSSCLPKHFTEGQRIRMIATLETRRTALITSKGCLQLGEYDVSVLDVNYNGYCVDSVCPMVTIRNDGLRSFNSVSIHYIIDGIAKPDIIWSGKLDPNQFTSVNLPCQSLQAGNHTLEVVLGNPDNQPDFYLQNNTYSSQFTSYTPLKIALQNSSPAHCISDGTIVLSCTGGTQPYNYQISNRTYPQTDPFFQLLQSGTYTITVKDSNECSEELQVNIPDSCQIVGVDSFKLNKDARYLGNGCYLLTDASTTQSGSVWYAQKVDLNQSFDVFFDINLGCNDQNGADGMAFVLQPLSASIGVAGAGLGYQGIVPSLAIEFDTYTNGNFYDPLFDHMAIMRNGFINHSTSNNLAGPVQILTGNANAEDCNFHKMLIRWNSITKTLEVYVDCEFRLKYTSDLVKTIFRNDPKLYIGFTAATGQLVNVQQVCFNYISIINKLDDYTICRGEAIQITSATRFEKYKWSPSFGVSNTNIRNPIFSPDTTTSYILEQTDFCGFNYLDTFTIFVRNPELNYKLELTDSCGNFSGAEVTVLNSIADSNVLYSLDGSNFSSQNKFFIQDPGLYTLYAKDGNCLVNRILRVEEYKHKLRDSILWIEPFNCKDSGRILVNAIEGIPPYQYRMDNGSWQTGGEFNNLAPGIYNIEIRDQTSCNIFRTVEIKEVSNALDIIIDTAQLIMNCCNPEAFIDLQIISTLPLYYLSMDGTPWTTDPTFRNIAPGKHKILARDEDYCVSDSIEFEVWDQRITTRDTQRLQLCEGEFVTVGSSVYYATGWYTDIFKNKYCCDSIIVTDLSVHPVFNKQYSQIICESDSVRVGSKIYHTSGNYIDTLQTTNGCDSIIQTDLLVNPEYILSASFSICQGDTVNVGFNKYFASGRYMDSLQTQFGCDSIITSTINVHSRFNEIHQHKLCKGQQIMVGNKTYNKTGYYRDTLQSHRGCDSIIQSQLFIDTILADLTIDSIHCFGDKDGRIEIITKSGFPEFQFALNNIQGLSSASVFNDLDAGNYILYVKDSLGCIESYFVTLNEPKELKAEIEQEINIKLGDIIRFNPVLNFIPVNIVWYPTIGLSCNDCLNPEVQALDNIEYVATFSDAKDCFAKIKLNIVVDKSSDVYLPNAFSPNGDQINDRLIVIGGNGIKEILQLSIYNRWGEKVFENRHFLVNDQEAGWDGRVNGELLNPGPFVYYLKALRIDGKEIVKTGDILLAK